MRQRSEKAKAAWDHRRAANEAGRCSLQFVNDAKLMLGAIDWWQVSK
jgi:hypothetical protein